MLNLCPDSLAFLDAVAARHSLRGRSEAFRHVAAALAGAYNVTPPKVVRARTVTSQREAREARHAAYTPVRPFAPAAHLQAFATWLDTGRSPGEAALTAACEAGLPPETCQAVFGWSPS